MIATGGSNVHSEAVPSVSGLTSDLAETRVARAGECFVLIVPAVGLTIKGGLMYPAKSMKALALGSLAAGCTMVGPCSPLKEPFTFEQEVIESDRTSYVMQNGGEREDIDCESLCGFLDEYEYISSIDRGIVVRWRSSRNLAKNPMLAWD